MVIETSGSASYGIFVPLMNRKLAWIYLGIMAFNLALSIIPVCYLAIIVSIFRPDGYIAIGAAFFFYFLFYCTNSLPWIFSYSTLSSRPGNASYSEMIYNFLFFSCCMVLSGLGVKRQWKGGLSVEWIREGILIAKMHFCVGRKIRVYGLYLLYPHFWL